jgi:hypothetical protein
MTDVRKRDMTGTLRYSLGQRIAGRVCAADEAFDQLSREVWKLTYGSTWDWFAERLRVVETSLQEAGGFDEQLADEMESEGCYFGPTEVVERFDRTGAMCADLDALTGAFFVTIQPRLNAVKLAAERIYQVAIDVDGLTVGPKKIAMPADYEAAWEIANYVKHNDEWDDTLDRRQQRAFDVLCRLGVGATAKGQRRLVRWPLIMAACALSGETSLAPAVGTIVARCRAACQEITDAIQADFAPIAAEVEAVRQANIPRLAIRPEPRPRRTEE